MFLGSSFMDVYHRISLHSLGHGFRCQSSITSSSSPSYLPSTKDKIQPGGKIDVFCHHQKWGPPDQELKGDQFQEPSLRWVL